MIRSRTRAKNLETLRDQITTTSRTDANISFAWNKNASPKSAHVFRRPAIAVTITAATATNVSIGARAATIFAFTTPQATAIIFRPATI